MLSNGQHPSTPAEAGVQSPAARTWTPASAGVEIGRELGL